MSSDVVVGIRLTADGSGLVGEVRLAEGELKKLTGQVKDADDAGKKNTKTAKSMGDAYRGLRGVLATLGIAAVVREFGQLLNTNTALNNSLRLVTENERQLTEVRRELFDISQATRGDLEGTVDLYSKLARATEELGYSQGDLLRVTETVNKTITMGGTAAASANAALVQLSQGLASGTLRGEELNSVMEQTPELARTLAAGLGISRGELRKLGQEGKITADAIIDALLKMADSVDEEFEKSLVTISQGWTLVKNAVLEAANEFDKVTGLSTSVAEGLEGIAKSLSNIDGESMAAMLDFLQGLAEVAVLLAAAHFLGPLLASITTGAIAAAGAFNLLNASLVAAAVQMQLVSGAAATLKAAVAFLGGPAGLFILAAGGIYLWATRAGEAEVATRDWNLELEKLRGNTAALKLNELETMLADVNVQYDMQAARIAHLTASKGDWNAELVLEEQHLAAIKAVQDELISQTERLRKEAEKYAKGRRDGSNSNKDDLDTLQKYVDKLKDELFALGKSDDALKRYATQKAIAGQETTALGQQAKKLTEQIIAQTAALEAEAAAQEALGELLDEAIQQQEEMEAAYDARMKSNKDLVQSLQDEYDLMLLGDRERAIEVELRKLSADATEEQVQQVRELAGQMYDAAIAAQAMTAAEQAAAQEAERMAHTIEQSLTDSLMSAFTEGESLAKTFIKNLKAMFNTLVLRPIISYLVSPVAGIVGSMLPGGAAAGTPGGLGAGGNLVSNISTFLGGNSIASGLNAGAGMLGFGPTGIPSAATGLDALPLFGGSNLGFGLAGLAGGLIGNQFGGYGGIGGSIGGMAGFGLTAAGSALSGTALGATLGTTVFPIVGTLVGALIGSLIGSLFGKKGDRTPDLQVTPTDLANTNPEIRQTSSGGTNIQNWVTESPFGNLQWRTKHDAFGSVADAEQFAAALDAVAVVEKALADFAGPEVTTKIAEAMDAALGEAMIKLAEDSDEWEAGLEGFIKKRFDLAFGIIGGAMEKVYGSIIGGGADALSAAAATVDLFSALENLTDAQEAYYQALEESNKTLWDSGAEQVTEVHKLIAAYDGTLDSTVALTNGLNGLLAAELYILDQIEGIRQRVNSETDNAIDRLKLDRMASDEERYNYRRDQIDELVAQLAQATKPEEIERLYDEITKLANEARGYLSDEQLQGRMGEELLAFLEGIRELTLSRLDVAENLVADTVKDVLESAANKLDSFAAKVAPAADAIAAGGQAIQIAAGAISTAASKFSSGTSVTVVVEGGLVG